MQVYKYSDEGIDHLVRQNLIRSGTVLGLGVLAVFGVLIFINGVSELPLFLPGFALVVFLLGWTQYRGLGKVRSLLQSTEFELDEEQLRGRHSSATTTIRREEVVRVEHRPDGILVKGRTSSQTLQLKKELAPFDDLAARLEQWLPPGVPRTEVSRSAAFWIMPLSLATIGLMLAGLAVNDPKVAVPCCLMVVAVFMWAIVASWRSTQSANRKLMVLITLIPMSSLLFRVYSLVK
jgi:hypothetical protein